METEHTETVVEKAVAFVKDMFGIPSGSAPGVEARTEYRDSAPEVTAENAMRLNPNAYEGLVPPESGMVLGPKTERADDAERLRREVDEQPRPKGALELNAESARAEDGG
jgi:hypothetical protein